MALKASIRNTETSEDSRNLCLLRPPAEYCRGTANRGDRKPRLYSTADATDTAVIFLICRISKNQSPDYLETKGRRARALDLLTSVVSILWCFAQVPVILLGRILPLSVMKRRSESGFL